MLPFLKARKDGGSMMVLDRKPDEQPSDENDSHKEAIRACARDLLNAFHANDEDAAAEALKAAFEILDAMPHVEGPHEDKEEG